MIAIAFVTFVAAGIGFWQATFENYNDAAAILCMASFTIWASLDTQETNS